MRVAMAGGAAFTFGYAEHAELLRAAGADVVTVDPLRDESLPAGTDALILGGGFPEEHTADLAANLPLRAAIAAFAAAGRPISAECAGLLYLATTLDGVPMCGVLDVAAVMGPRLTLGYRHTIAATASPLTPAGTPLGAHEFHRTVLPAPGAATGAAWWLPVTDDPLPPARDTTAHRGGDATRGGGGETATRWRAEGFVRGQVHASYLHLHWAGQPDIARRLLEAAHATRPAHPADTGHPADAIDAA